MDEKLLDVVKTEPAGWRHNFVTKNGSGYMQPHFPPHLIAFMAKSMMQEVDRRNDILLTDLMKVVVYLFPYYDGEENMEIFLGLLEHHFTIIPTTKNPNELLIKSSWEKNLFMCNEICFFMEKVPKDMWQVFSPHAKAITNCFQKMQSLGYESDSIALPFIISLIRFSQHDLACHCDTNRPSFVCIVRNIAKYFPHYVNHLCAPEKIPFKVWCKIYGKNNIILKTAGVSQNVLSKEWLISALKKLILDKPLFFIQMRHFYFQFKEFPELPQLDKPDINFGQLVQNLSMEGFFKDSIKKDNFLKGFSSEETNGIINHTKELISFYLNHTSEHLKKRNFIEKANQWINIAKETEEATTSSSATIIRNGEGVPDDPPHSPVVNSTPSASDPNAEKFGVLIVPHTTNNAKSPYLLFPQDYGTGMSSSSATAIMSPRKISSKPQSTSVTSSTFSDAKRVVLSLRPQLGSNAPSPFLPLPKSSVPRMTSSSTTTGRALQAASNATQLGGNAVSPFLLLPKVTMLGSASNSATNTRVPQTNLNTSPSTLVFSVASSTEDSNRVGLAPQLTSSAHSPSLLLLTASTSGTTRTTPMESSPTKIINVQEGIGSGLQTNAPPNSEKTIKVLVMPPDKNYSSSPVQVRLSPRDRNHIRKPLPQFCTKPRTILSEGGNRSVGFTPPVSKPERTADFQPRPNAPYHY